MPIDMTFFRSLPLEEQRAWNKKFIIALNEMQERLEGIERKIKEAITDNTTPSELSALLTYRDELKKDLNQLKSDREQIERFNRNEEFLKPDPTFVASTTSGAGAVNIRADDRKLVKVPGTKTYGEILEKKKKDEQAEKEASEIATLEKNLKKLEEYKKVEAKKRTETSKH